MIHIVRPGAHPAFPDGLEPRRDGLIAIGGMLEPRLVLEAYKKGIFPWTGAHPIPWYSPDPRMILLPFDVKVRRTMRQTLRSGRFEVRFDHDFAAMIGLCASIERLGQRGTWITANMMRCWCALHIMGHAHSVEVYERQSGVLAGGLYGMAIGGAFFGESMASRQPNASKVALVTLCARLQELRYEFIDCQQSTAHLRRMGGIDVPRQEYLRRLEAAVGQPGRW